MLDPDDYDHESDTLKVWGKGGQERVACFDGRGGNTFQSAATSGDTAAPQRAPANLFLCQSSYFHVWRH